MVKKVDKLLSYLPTHWVKDEEGENYKFFNSFNSNLTHISTQIENLKKTIQLSTSTGTDLNDIGQLFLLNRLEDENDNDYRARIKGFWPGFSGGGVIESIKSTVSRMTGIAEDDVTVTEYHSGSYIQPLKIMITAVIPTLGVSVSTVSEVLRNTKAAGMFIIPNISSSITDSWTGYSSETTNISTSNYIYADFAESDGYKSL